MKDALTAVEQYCIDKLIEEGKSAQEIAKFIKKSIGQIKDYIKLSKSTLDTSQPISISDPQNFMINRTTGKKAPGVTIMTQAASERADESRLKIHEPSRTYKTAIHKIRDNG